jgi:hypothetical protein
MMRLAMPRSTPSGAVIAEVMRAHAAGRAERNTADKRSGFFARLRRAEPKEIAEMPGGRANPLACSRGNPSA